MVGPAVIPVTRRGPLNCANDTMQDINDKLAISDAQRVRDLPEENEFDEVVTLGYYDKTGYERPIASTTGDEFVFRDGPHEYEVFEAAVEYVLDALARGDRVLVHCQAGISRSGGVCSAVLSEYEGISLGEALGRVREARSIVNPAPEIRDSMEEYTGDEIIRPPNPRD